MIRRIAVSCFAFLCVTLAVIPLAAQKPPQFSSDLKFTSPRGISGTGKLYFGGDKVRIEMQRQSHESVVINDTARQVSYILLPQQQMYMEMSAGMHGSRRGPDWRAYDASNPCADEPDVTCRKVGTDTVDGRLCNKWQFSGKGTGSDRTVWIDQKTGIPIKTEMADGAKLELTNIKEGDQAASLFEVPAGYQKMDMGDMMQTAPRPH